MSHSARASPWKIADLDSTPGEPGADTRDADTGEPVPSAALPWHTPISQALQDGRITVEKVDSLRKGLGDLNTVITPEALAKFHNEGWHIRLLDDDYWLRPPPGIDPEQHLILLPPKNPPLLDGESACRASG